MRVVPGCVFAPADVLLFEEISEAIAEGAVSAPEARQLSRTVQQALSGGLQDGLFEVLTRRLPALVPLQLVIGPNSRAQQRAFRIVRTIFEAIALTQSSGTMLVVTEPVLQASAGKKTP
jgi:hypothetical protein